MASEVAVVLVEERNLAAAFTVAKVVDAATEVGFIAPIIVAAALAEVKLEALVAAAAAVGESSSNGLLPAGAPAAAGGGSSTAADDGIVMVQCSWLWIFCAGGGGMNYCGGGESGGKAVWRKKSGKKIWRERFGNLAMQEVAGRTRGAVSWKWREETGKKLIRPRNGSINHAILTSGSRANFDILLLIISLRLSLPLSLCHALSELRVEEKSMDLASESVLFRRLTDR